MRASHIEKETYYKLIYLNVLLEGSSAAPPAPPALRFLPWADLEIGEEEGENKGIETGN